MSCTNALPDQGPSAERSFRLVNTETSHWAFNQVRQPSRSRLSHAIGAGTLYGCDSDDDGPQVLRRGLLSVPPHTHLATIRVFRDPKDVERRIAIPIHHQPTIRAGLDAVRRWSYRVGKRALEA